MRRSIRSLVVALLCLNLCVDSAKACWLLRHRRRSGVCRPVACESICRSMTTPVPCQSSCHGAAESCGDLGVSLPAGVETEVAHASVFEEGIVEGPASATGSVVVHEPTTVLGPPDTTPSQPMPAAQPMPTEKTGAVPQVAGQEPLPILRPATPAAIAPASNEQPVTEPAADVAAKEPSPPPAPASEPTAPMPAAPAPVDALAGGPAVASPMPAKPNLFDLYGDEVEETDDAIAENPRVENGTDDEDEDVDQVERPATEPAVDAVAEPAAEGAAAAEMPEKDSQPAAVAEDEAEPPAAAESPAAAEEPAEESPETDPAEPEPAEPAAAAMSAPNEPLRRWTDDTGTRHVQGWLVEIRAETVRILKVSGRHTTVAVESLSTEDRAYVSAVGARLAAEGQAAGPASTDTAGL